MSWREGFDAGLRSCQLTLRPVIDDLRAQLAVAAAYREHHEFVIEMVADKTGLPMVIVDDYVTHVEQLEEKLTVAEQLAANYANQCEESQQRHRESCAMCTQLKVELESAESRAEALTRSCDRLRGKLEEAEFGW